LPITASWFPTPRELVRHYDEATYTLAVSASQQSVLLRPSKTDDEAAARLMRELLLQRLQQNFQIASPSKLREMGYTEELGKLDGRDSLLGGLIRGKKVLRVSWLWGSPC
jgi:hypothetical protein